MSRQKRKNTTTKSSRKKAAAKVLPTPLAFGEQTTLSVVVPYFNIDRYLRRLFNSIFVSLTADKQQLIEVILVDDGSDERQGIEAKKKCAEFGVTYIRQKNRGVGAAKNLGLSAAKGKYIWFVDSDDYLKQGWQNATLEAIQWVNADIIATPFDILVNNTETTPVWTLNISDQGFYDYCSFPEAWINVGNNYNYIFRLDNLIKNNLLFDTQLTLGEDAVFNVSAFLKSDTFFNLKSTSYVQNRMQAGTLSRPSEGRLLEAFADELKSHKMIGALLQNHPLQRLVFNFSQVYNVQNKLKLVKDNFERDELSKIIEIHRAGRDGLKTCPEVQKLMYDVLKSDFRMSFAPHQQWF